MDRFEECLTEVLKHEGGWSDHKDDPGGATMKGVTLGTYSEYLGRQASKQELRAIPWSHIVAIYRKGYWDKVLGDQLPRGVDLCVFDFAVNSGPGRAIKTLQASVGAKADGVMGPATLAAVRAKGDPVAIVSDVCQRRMAFLRGLKHWPTFRNGWTARVNAIKVKAVMDAGGSKLAPTVPKPKPGFLETILEILKGLWK